MSSSDSPVALRIVVASFASALSETSTYVLEALKMRLQLNTGRNVSAWAVFKDMVKKEGVAGSFGGLSAALIRQLVSGGLCE